MIKVQNLTRTFGDFRAVDEVSFEVAAGEMDGMRAALINRSHFGASLGAWRFSKIEV